jgi:hypothetical protein
MEAKEIDIDIKCLRRDQLPDCVRPKEKIESPSQSIPAVDFHLLEPGSMVNFLGQSHI